MNTPILHNLAKSGFSAVFGHRGGGKVIAAKKIVKGGIFLSDFAFTYGRQSLIVLLSEQSNRAAPWVSNLFAEGATKKACLNRLEKVISQDAALVG